MAFRKEWRRYQVRLLDQLDRYLDDRRVHLVAAPGSGKTVVGLEVLRRIDQPTLVLCPTITIRDQWVDRLVNLFLSAGCPTPAWVSTDLRSPRSLTVSTYQALHAFCSGEPDEESPTDRDENGPSKNRSETDGDGAVGNHGSRADVPIPELLSRANFRTLVLDEAHHLRTEWWRTLTNLAEQLETPTIVALTATPPYDVSSVEWQRYEALCGPVDAEVSVPELVRAGDLCPHQDYVYFSTPTQKEQTLISDFRFSTDAFVSRLKSDAAFSNAIRSHPWISAPDQHTEEILDDPAYLSSMVIFLNAVGEAVPPAVFATLGLTSTRIPALNLEWLEVLLSNCLYRDRNVDHAEAALKAIRHELSQMRAVERSKVTLRAPSDHLTLLGTSVGKLKSIEEIVTLESRGLGDSLRCVILTDFIRQSELPKASGQVREFEDIGSVPIFEFLRASSVAGIRLGVLTGSLIIAPAGAEQILRRVAAEQGIDPQDISLCPLPHDPSFSFVDIRRDYYRGGVRLITSVFERGGITVLIGTKSLLGEGWDAPCVNTLVLASSVGSFVLSNQMRGRAIRVDPTQPRKTANIWHLVCVEEGPLGPGDDYARLVRRCSTFVGVSRTAPVIENGTERLAFGDPPFTRSQIDRINAETSRRARDRAALFEEWQQALESGATRHMAEGLKAPHEVVPRGLFFNNTIAALLVQAGYVALYTADRIARTLGREQMTSDIPSFVLTVLAAAAIVAMPWSLVALWRFVRYGTPEGSVRQIGQAILDGLRHQGSIDSDAEGFAVHAERRRGGSVFCWIAGGTGKERATFLRALGETLNPIDNPRYLLARRKVWRLFQQDYFAVPEALGHKKEAAQFFAQRWNRLVGPAHLVFTRTPEGRRLLLRARGHSLSAAFQGRAERVSCWK